MSDRDDYDAVVIGGGPAGGLSAYLLARLGWRTALLERGRRHRPKACGDCLSPRATGLLGRMGLLDEVRRLSAGPTRRLRVHLDGLEPLSVPIEENGEAGPGLLVDRGRFDQGLVDRAAAAGARIWQPAAARVVSWGPHLACIEVLHDGSRRRLRARLVVGADGLRSAVARAAGLGPAVGGARKFGFAARVPCPYAAAIGRHTIEMFVVEGGYLGVVRHGGGTLHVAGLIAAGEAPARNPFSFVESVAARFEVLRRARLDRLERRRGGRLLGAGPMPWRPSRVAGDRVALVGDAAGYVEPFTGEGMSWALESASVLAEALADERPGAWTPDTYRRAWRDRIGRRQRWCRGLALALGRPHLCRLLFRGAAGHPRLVRWLVGRVVRP